MKLSNIFSVLLSVSLLTIPMAYAGDGKGMCSVEKQQELVRSLTLDEKQQKLWHTYINSLEVQKTEKMKIKAMAEEMKNSTPNTAVEAAEKRLATREKMLSMEQAQIKHMKTSVADLKAFYHSLNAQQKAEFDAAFKAKLENKKHKKK